MEYKAIELAGGSVNRPYLADFPLFSSLGC
jgi:hypothetical protein